jgi:hypothetical protein
MKGDITSMHFYWGVGAIVALNPAFPSWTMLVFMFLLAILGTSHGVPSNKHCPSARCAYAANAVGKDLDMFSIGAVSLNHIS